MLKFIISIIGLLLFIVTLSLTIIMYLNSPVTTEIIITEQDGIKSSGNGGILFEVRRGESAMSVGRRLENANIIRNRYFWYLLCRVKKEIIKTGTYQLELPANQLAIHGILVSGRQILQKVTIPEGVTLKKTARILEDAGICPRQDFLDSAENKQIINHYKIPNATMEGYLFPDTYLFPFDYNADSVVRAMADNFFEKISTIDGGLSPEELNKRVILASIIEREYRLAEEAPVMAGVFFNRLDIGMALQSCATVEYIITEIQGLPHPVVLLNKDIEIRNPYNTYILPGLPPGPISNPGTTSLHAVFYPDKNNYLYFRLEDSDSGKHYFSRTLDEHIRAGQIRTKGLPL